MSVSNTSVGAAVAGIGNKLGDWMAGPSKTYATLRAIELEHHFGAQRDQQTHQNNLELLDKKHANDLARITHETAGHIVREKYKNKFGAQGKLQEARGLQRIHMQNAQFAMDNLDKGVAYNNRNLSVNPTKPTSPNTPSTITAAQQAIHDHVAKMRNPRISQSTLDSHMKQVLQLHGGDKRKVNSLIKARLASHRPGTPLPVR